MLKNEIEVQKTKIASHLEMTPYTRKNVAWPVVKTIERSPLILLPVSLKRLQSYIKAPNIHAELLSSPRTQEVWILQCMCFLSKQP